MTSASTRLPTASGLGSVSHQTQALSGLNRLQLLRRGAVASLALTVAGTFADKAGASIKGAKPPDLPAGFHDTFTSQHIDTGELRLHAVIGGEGPPLLLVHGWPQTWYAWRLLMPALARDFTVIAVDQRGIGMSDRPADGYDAGTLAGDMIGLMDALGHERFAVVGHDTGFIISYALAADYADRVERVALAEIPGPPSLAASPPLFVPSFVNDKLWHIPFNRVENLPEQLIRGREDIYFGYEFAIQGGNLPEDLIKYYIRILSNPEALRGSLAFYRAWDATVAQNGDRAKSPLKMPVLAIGGERSYGAMVGEHMQSLADDVQGAVIPGAGHWLAEEAPDKVLAALAPFLAPYRDGSASARRAGAAVAG